MTEPLWTQIYTEEVYLIPGDQPGQSRDSITKESATNAPEEDAESLPDSDAALKSDAASQAPPPIIFEGGNGSGVVVLVPTAPAAADRELLFNILKAAGLSSDDIALVTWRGGEPEQLLAELQPSVILSFGLDTAPWPEGPSYTILKVNTIKHLKADALPILGNDTGLKRQLWNQIRVLFEL